MPVSTPTMTPPPVQSPKPAREETTNREILPATELPDSPCKEITGNPVNKEMCNKPDIVSQQKPVCVCHQRDRNV